jgi:hypothetical protein
MRRAVIYFFYLVVFVVLLFLPSAVRYLRFYGLNGVQQQEPPVYEAASIPERVPTPAASAFVDDPEVGQGLVLLDAAHDNRFELGEINYLDSRLAARGAELVPFEEGDLATALRPVSAFVVIAPMASFSEEEVLAVDDFVQRGGRLLMVGDPTRFEIVFDEEEDFDPFSYSIDTDEIALNSLANAFDLVFNGDYLYNTVHNEGNFQNILLEQAGFDESELTDGLKQLAFYGSHSIQTGPSSHPLLSADDDTWSSATDRSGGLVLAALGDRDRVLAVGDIDFLSEPYYTVYDNGRFISQVADFLVGAERDYVLGDFPYFYGDDVELIYAGDPELGPDAFDEVVALQNALRLTGRKLSLAAEAGGDADVLFAGLYNQSDDVSAILDAAGISLVIDPPVETESPAAVDEAEAGTPGDATEDVQDGDADAAVEEEEEQIRRIESSLGTVQMSGTSLILVSSEGEGRQVVVLASSADGLENALERLIKLSTSPAEPALGDCLIQDEVALCPTGISDEVVEPELVTSDQPSSEPSGPTDSESEGESGDGDTPDGGDGGDFNADLQGPISIGDSLEATLEEGQSHGWELSDGPATINIVLRAGDDVDGVLELYDESGSLLGASDSTFEGEDERLDLIQIEGDQVYTIVVRDFFMDGGSYTLDVIAVTPEELGAVDQGELTAGEPVEGVLDTDEAHAWRFTIDSPAEASIILTNGSELDGFIILFAPDGAVLQIVDETLAGEEEALIGYSLEGGGEYTVVVGEYAGGGGTYELLLDLSG